MRPGAAPGARAAAGPAPGRPPRAAAGGWDEPLDWRATALAIGLALEAHLALAVWGCLVAG